MSANRTISLSIVVAVNDKDVLAWNLSRSPALETGHVRLYAYFNQVSASQAYNQGLRETDSDYIAFIHQDVYLPENWLSNLQAAITALNAIDPDWALLGTFGVRDDRSHVGCVWSSGLGSLIGEPLPRPVPVVSVDELAFVLRRGAGCTFDPDLPSFHLYGTDLVQIAKRRGKNSYVANIPVIHNSFPVSTLSGGYAAAYRYLQDKWQNILPIQTLIVPITKSNITLLIAQAQNRLSRARRFARSLSPASDPRRIAKRLGYE